MENVNHSSTQTQTQSNNLNSKPPKPKTISQQTATAIAISRLLSSTQLYFVHFLLNKAHQAGDVLLTAGIEIDIIHSVIKPNNS